MLFLDFAEAKDLPEGVTPEVLANESVQEFIKGQFESAFERRFETEASGLKKTNEDLKAEKIKLKGFLDEKNGIDVAEYERLKKLAENSGDATKQIEVLETEKEAIRESYETKLLEQQEAAASTLNSLHNERLQNKIAQGVREHNAKFPTVAMQEGAERWVIEEAKSVWKRDDKGNYIPMNGERVLTGDGGDVMTYSEWVNSLRKRPEFAPLFKAPSGGGAPGGSGASGGQHFNPKNLAGNKDERKAAIAARFNLTE